MKLVIKLNSHSTNIENRERFNFEFSNIYFACLLVMVWGMRFIDSYLRIFISKLPFLSDISSLVIPFLTVIFLCLSFNYIMKSIKPSDIIFVLGLGFIYVINLALFEKNFSYLFSKAFGLWLVAIPLYFVGLRIDMKRDLSVLRIVSILNILGYTAVSLLNDSFLASVSGGDMYLAYNLLPHVCLLIYYGFSHKRIVDKVFAVLGFCMILFLGNRGSMMCMFAFILLYLLFFRYYKHPVIVYGTLVCGGGVLLNFYYPIVKIVRDLAFRWGVSTRVFDRILDGSFFVSVGRNNIKDKLLQAISDKPFIGYGIGSDYTIAGNYAHNLILELWTAFGLFIGSLVVAALLWVLIRAIRKSTTEYEKTFVLLLSCCVVMKLMMSGTYLDEPYFFFLIGICVGLVRKASIRKTTE